MSLLWHLPVKVWWPTAPIHFRKLWQTSPSPLRPPPSLFLFVDVTQQIGNPSSKHSGLTLPLIRDGEDHDKIDLNQRLSRKLRPWAQNSQNNGSCCGPCLRDYRLWPPRPVAGMRLISSSSPSIMMERTLQNGWRRRAFPKWSFFQAKTMWRK